MRKLLFLTAILWLKGIVIAQNPHQCAVDSFQHFYHVNDSSYHMKRQAFINRVNSYRANPPTSILIKSGEPTVSLDPECNTTRFIIPVVFHINHDSEIQVSDTQVKQQLQLLNDAFLPHQIQFCLAGRRPNGDSFNGINRFPSSLIETNNELQFQMASLMQVDYYNPNQYLNIYVVKEILENNQPSGYLAYSTSYPWQNFPSGIVIRHDFFGDSASCHDCGILNVLSRGRILIHEVGHYLGLFHPFEGGCTGGNTANTCDKEGDLCCDTRPISAPGNSCSIDTSYRSCPSYYLAIPENRTNYMDYSGESCMDNFTLDQTGIMHAAIEIYRSGLVYTENVNNLASTCCAGSAWFDAANNQLCTGDTLYLSAYQYNSTVDYRWELFRTGENVPYFSQTTTNHLFSFSGVDTGVYDVTLSIITPSGDTFSLTRHNFLSINYCGTPLASEQAAWFFGDHAGLFFSTNGVFKDIRPKYNDPNNILCAEGSISQSDTLGNLLFYGGPRQPDDYFNPEFHFQIFNKDYDPMPGGRIKGDPSAAQSGLVLPVPGSSTRYYLISNCGSIDAYTVYPDSVGLRYSIIDMSLNGGLGGIDPTALNVPVEATIGSDFNILDSAFLGSEFLTAIPKCSGDGFWLITSDHSASHFDNHNKLTVFSVTSSGIAHHVTADIVCNINFGQLKASPDGNFLATPEKIVRFNRSTGVPTLYRDIPISGVWGLSFSPDSRMLYLLEVRATGGLIWQTNLESSDSVLFAIHVGTSGSGSNDQMQLGPDGKIYFSQAGQTRLGVIQYPDLLSNIVQPNLCEYSTQGPITQSGGLGGVATIGLPNMVDAKKQEVISLDFLAVIKDCGTVNFYPNNLCEGSYKWYFGDGDSSDLETPEHIYSYSDSFTITLMVSGIGQVVRKIKIGIEQPIIAGKSVICDTSVIEYYNIANPNPFVQYTWHSNNGIILPDLSSPYGTRVNWEQPGNLVLKAFSGRDGCQAFDTLLVRFSHIDSNHITVNEAPCLSLEPLKIYGNEIISNNIEYKWQFSYNGTNWLAVSETDTLPNLEINYGDTVLYYRRLVIDAGCVYSSNLLHITPPVNFLGGLKPLAVCGADGETYSIPINLNSTGNQNIELELYHYKEVLPGIYNWETERHTYPYDFSVHIKRGDSVKYKIIVEGCDSVYTNTIVIRDFQLNYMHPYECNNVNVSGNIIDIQENTDTFFYAILGSANQWLLECSNADSFFKWDKYIYGVGYVEIPESHNDTLFISPDLCSIHHYRVSIKMTSPYIGEECTWRSSCTSSYASILRPYDLWSRDSPSDSGGEPNLASNGDIWNSPDIWNNRNASVYSANHQNPVYGQTNKLFARVRNKGGSYSKPAKVYLYWTLPSTQEDWPKHWTYDIVHNGFENQDHGLVYPLGSEINEVGINIGPLAPDADTVISYEWSPPNPEWYYFDSSGVKVYYTQRMLCFLMRIVECEDAPYGMTFPEVVSTKSNVENNNNITTKNVTLFNSDGEWTLPVRGYFPVIIGAQEEFNSPIRLNLVSVYGTDFYDYGTVSILLEDSLLTEWIAAGENGYGFSRSGNRFTITDPILFEISEIPVEFGRIHQVLIDVKVDSLPLMDSVPFQFKLVQFSDSATEPNGGVYVEGIIPMKPPVIPVEKTIKQEDNSENPVNEPVNYAQNNEVKPEDESNSKSNVHLSSGNQVIAYPNPFDKEVTFKIELAQETEVELVVYNSLGAKVGNIPSQTQSEGVHQLKFSGAHLAPGIYHCTIKLGEDYHNIKLIISR